MFRPTPKKVKKSLPKKILKRKDAERRAKFGNKHIFDPMHGNFDSKLEYHVYLYLLKLEQRGLIRDIQRQVPIEIIPSYNYYKFKQLVKKFKFEKHILRPMRYIADFTYYDNQGRYHVCDAKGRKTEKYIIKKKLLLVLKGIYIEEWCAKDITNMVFEVDMGFPADIDQTVKPWIPPKSVHKV